MLVIRRDQMDMFRANARHRFVEGLVTQLVSRPPWREPGGGAPGGLHARVETSLAEAEQLGLVTEFDCYRFVEAAVILGPGFLARPDVVAVLGDRGLSPTDKMDVLDAISAFAP